MADYYWNGGGDNYTWSDSNNWGGAGFPTAGDVAHFDSASTQFGLTVSDNGGSQISFSALYMEDGTSLSGSLTLQTYVDFTSCGNVVLDGGGANSDTLYFAGGLGCSSGDYGLDMRGGGGGFTINFNSAIGGANNITCSNGVNVSVSGTVQPTAGSGLSFYMNSTAGSTFVCTGFFATNSMYFTLNSDNASTLTVNGDIDAYAFGSGVGYVTMTATNNCYIDVNGSVSSGGTNYIDLNTYTSLAGSATIDISGGVTAQGDVDISIVNSSALTVGGAISAGVAGNGSCDISVSTGSNATLTGTVYGNNGGVIVAQNNASNLYINGVLNGGGFNIIASDTANLYLNGLNTFISSYITVASSAVAHWGSSTAFGSFGKTNQVVFAGGTVDFNGLGPGWGDYIWRIQSTPSYYSETVGPYNQYVEWWVETALPAGNFPLTGTNDTLLFQAAYSPAYQTGGSSQTLTAGSITASGAYGYFDFY